MINEKYDLMQILVVLGYLFMIFSFTYMPYERDLEGNLTSGATSVFSYAIIYMFFKWVIRPFGVETNKTMDSSMFLIWVTFLISLYTKVFTGKSNGEEVLWFGIGFQFASITILTGIIYLENALYYTGRRLD